MSCPGSGCECAGAHSQHRRADLQPADLADGQGPHDRVGHAPDGVPQERQLGHRWWARAAAARAVDDAHRPRDEEPGAAGETYVVHVFIVCLCFVSSCGIGCCSYCMASLFKLCLRLAWYRNCVLLYCMVIVCMMCMVS